MRSDADADTVVRAVAKAIEAKFERGDWLELGLITGTSDRIKRHSRLLRSLDWGDRDYHGHVIEMVPVVLGERHMGSFGGTSEASERFRNLKKVEDFVGLEQWLAKHEPELYDELYSGEHAEALEELESAADDLGIVDVLEHAARIRQGLRDDPAQAVGSSKELLETVLKNFLGLHGVGPETRLNIPQWSGSRLMDTVGLSVLGGLLGVGVGGVGLELGWGEVAEGRVPAGGVVEAFDVLEDL